MRSRVLFMAVCVVLGGAASAAAQAPEVGVKAGLNFANVKFSGDGADISFDRRTGFVGGLFVVMPVSRMVAVQAEGLYSQKGAKFNESGVDGKVELDYFEIPVLLRVSGAPASTSFHVFAGPSFGIRVRAHSTGTFDGETHTEDIGKDVKRGDVGLVIGAGVTVGHFTIDGRQTWGMTNINKDETEPGLTIKNRAFAVMAGVRF